MARERLTTSARGAALALAGGLLIGGCAGSGVSDADSDTTVKPRTSAGTSTAPTENRDFLVAANTVRQEVSGSTVISIATERENGRDGWVVHVVTGEGVELAAMTSTGGAEILTGPDLQETYADDRADHLARITDATLDHEAATAAVSQAVAGRIIELNLDDYDGTTVWDADLVSAGKDKVEVTIDASTGNVIHR